MWKLTLVYYGYTKCILVLSIFDNSNSMVFQFSTSLAKNINKNFSFIRLNLLGNNIFGVELVAVSKTLVGI